MSKSQVALGSTNPIAVRMADIVQKKLIAEVYSGLLELRYDCGFDLRSGDLIEQVQKLIDKIENSGQHRVD